MPKGKEHFISDTDGHYDVDGVSTSQDGVIVASEKLSSKAGDFEPKEYPPLNEQTLKEVQTTADQTSIKLKNQKEPAQDGIPAKDLAPLRTAKYSHGYQDYLEFEKAGD